MDEFKIRPRKEEIIKPTAVIEEYNQKKVEVQNKNLIIEKLAKKKLNKKIVFYSLIGIAAIVIMIIGVLIGTYLMKDLGIESPMNLNESGLINLPLNPETNTTTTVVNDTINVTSAAAAPTSGGSSGGSSGGGGDDGGCVPNCDGKQCGSDECGGSCGGCGVGEECIQGLCVTFTCIEGLCNIAPLATVSSIPYRSFLGRTIDESTGSGVGVISTHYYMYSKSYDFRFNDSQLISKVRFTLPTNWYSILADTNGDGVYDAELKTVEKGPTSYLWGVSEWVYGEWQGEEPVSIYGLRLYEPKIYLFVKNGSNGTPPHVGDKVYQWDIYGTLRHRSGIIVSENDTHLWIEQSDGEGYFWGSSGWIVNSSTDSINRWIYSETPSDNNPRRGLYEFQIFVNSSNLDQGTTIVLGEVNNPNLEDGVSVILEGDVVNVPIYNDSQYLKGIYIEPWMFDWNGWVNSEPRGSLRNWTSYQNMLSDLRDINANLVWMMPIRLGTDAYRGPVPWPSNYINNSSPENYLNMLADDLHADGIKIFIGDRPYPGWKPKEGVNESLVFPGGTAEMAASGVDGVAVCYDESYSNNLDSYHLAAAAAKSANPNVITFTNTVAWNLAGIGNSSDIDLLGVAGYFTNEDPLGHWDPAISATRAIGGNKLKRTIITQNAPWAPGNFSKYSWVGTGNHPLFYETFPPVSMYGSILSTIMHGGDSIAFWRLYDMLFYNNYYEHVAVGYDMLDVLASWGGGNATIPKEIVVLGKYNSYGGGDSKWSYYGWVYRTLDPWLENIVLNTASDKAVHELLLTNGYPYSYGYVEYLDSWPDVSESKTIIISFPYDYNVQTSSIDLLISAANSGTRIILIGDPDYLARVNANKTTSLYDPLLSNPNVTVITDNIIYGITPEFEKSFLTNLDNALGEDKPTYLNRYGHDIELSSLEKNETEKFLFVTNWENKSVTVDIGINMPEGNYNMLQRDLNETRNITLSGNYILTKQDLSKFRVHLDSGEAKIFYIYPINYSKYEGFNSDNVLALSQTGGYASLEDQYVNDLDYSKDFSIEVLTKIEPHSIGGRWSSFIQKSGSRALYLSDQPGFAIGTNQGHLEHYTQQLTAKVGDGTNHLTLNSPSLIGYVYAMMTWDATAKELVFFINGNEYSRANNTLINASNIENSYNLKIGYGNFRELKRDIFLSRLWNRKLSDSEVFEIYNNYNLTGQHILPSGFDNQDLVSEWLMQETSDENGNIGTTYIKDTKGNNHLELINNAEISYSYGNLNLVYPDNGAIDVDKSVFLRVSGGYSELEDPIRPFNYYFQIDEINTFDSFNLKESGWIRHYSKYKPTLKPNTQYYWRAKVKDSLGQESSYTLINTFTTQGPTNWYVRPGVYSSSASTPVPAIGIYGNQDGISHENAWNGLREIVWGELGVEAGDNLYVCGEHVYNTTSSDFLAHQAVEYIRESGFSEEYPITIRMDCSEDEGVLYGIWKDLRSNYVWNGPDSNDVYWSEGFPYGAYYEFNGSNYIRLKNDNRTTWEGNFGTVFKNGSIYYIKTSDASNPDGKIYSSGGLGFGFSLGRSKYIEFYKGNFYGSIVSKDKISTSLPPPPSHIVFEDNLFNYGITYWLYSGHDYWTFKNNHFENAGNGIYTVGRDSSLNNGWGANYMLVQNNTFIHIGTPEFYHQDAHAIGVQGGRGHIIEGNYIEDTGSAIEFWTGYWPMKNMTVRNNFIKNIKVKRITGGAGIVVSGENRDDSIGKRTGFKIYNNIVMNTGIGKTEGWQGGGIGTNNKDLVEIYNNVIINPTGKGIGFGVMNAPPQGKIYNNIIVNPGGRYIQIIGDSGDWSNFSCDYNLYYNTTDLNDASEFYFAQAIERDNHSILANPMFVSSDLQIREDFILQNMSLAIDAGIDVGLPHSGDAPDMGAYEYQNGSMASMSMTSTTKTDFSLWGWLKILFRI